MSEEKNELDGFLISELIEKLSKLKDKHGDLRVWYASDYDWALPINHASVEDNEPWENAPIEPAVYLN